MKFSEFRKWYRSLHFSQKWFIWLIILRPVIDNFYYLKHISPFFSPLYIVGVLTPFLCMWSIIIMPQPGRTFNDSIMGGLMALVMFSLFLVVIKNFDDLRAYEISFQTMIAFFIFYFSRRLIRTSRDLDGILFSTLLAAGIASMFFLYEVLVQPFKNTITRGMDRLEGAYADVTIYGIYVTQSILISCYFLLRKHSTLSPAKRTWLMGICLSLGFLVLIRIIHASSTTVVITILLLFSLFYTRRSFARGVVFAGILLFVGIRFGSGVFEERFFPLIQSDLEVYMGERDESQIFHGRFKRWEIMWEEFSAQPLIAQLFGMPLSVEKPYGYITAGTHNDFLRILFLSGMIGFSLYLIFLFNVFIRIRKLAPAHRFLVLGVLATLLLYSVSTGPNLYAPLIYVVYPVFAFAFLPEKTIRRDT